MSLRIRRLRLHAVTINGSYGVEIPFQDKLVVLRANNTTGKSTCVQAIIYCLGLEKMLGPSRSVPLPHVMTRCLEDDGVEMPVIESKVLLEICNSKNEILTIQRYAHGDQDRRLISTWDGPALSNPTGSYHQTDYYATDSGAASRPAGFHTRLASFLGWNLPSVSRFNGTECPLYMECIFPLIVVEQKHGWAAIQSNMPTFFGIKEVAKRALEFLMGLEAYSLSLKRQQLQMEEATLKLEWKHSVSECGALLRPLNGRLRGMPEEPTADWPPAVLPCIEVVRDNEWVPLISAIDKDAHDLLVLGHASTDG